MACGGGSVCLNGTFNAGGADGNRTLVIPGGTLDGNVTNVVVIPNYLDVTNASLIVRAPALNTSAPIYAKEGFLKERASPVGASLDGARSHVRASFHMDRDFTDPIIASSFQSYIDDDYFFDMYDSDQDKFLGGNSGNLSGAAFEAVMGGQHNVIQGGADPEGDCACNPPAEQADPNAQPAGGEAATPQNPPPNQSGAPPPAGEEVSQYVTVFSGLEGSALQEYNPVLNCGPCFPGYGGNPDLCPAHCPVRRGIPYGDPNATPDSFFLELEQQQQSQQQQQRSGQAGPLNQTYNRPGSPNQTYNRPGPVLNQTGPVLKRTKPMSALNEIGSPLNQTGPALNQTEQNRTWPALNRTGPGLNRTGPVLNRTAPAMNRPCPASCGSTPGPNKTGPPPDLTTSKFYTSGPPALKGPSPTLDRTGSPNLSYGPPNITGPQTILNRTRSFLGQSSPHQGTFDGPPALQQSAAACPCSRSSPKANETFDAPAPPGLNQTSSRPSSRSNETYGGAGAAGPHQSFARPRSHDGSFNASRSGGFATPPSWSNVKTSTPNACGANRTCPVINRTRSIHNQTHPFTTQTRPGFNQTAPPLSQMRPATNQTGANQTYPAVNMTRVGSKINVSLSIDLNGTE